MHCTQADHSQPYTPYSPQTAYMILCGGFNNASLLAIILL